jgi:hypothetical protein
MQFMFGSGLLWASRTDIANATPVRFGALQDVSVDFDGELKELYSQYQFPIDVARGKTKITGKAKLARISSIQYNNMFFGQTVTTGQKLTSYDEADTSSAVITGATSAATASGVTLTFTSVPTGIVVGSLVSDTTASSAITAGTYVVSKASTTVTLSQAVASAVGSGDTISFAPAVVVSNSVNFLVDLGVRYAATGNPLSLTTAALAASAGIGNYALTASGSYAFSAADASTALLFDYAYTTTSGETVTGNNLLMGSSPRFIMTFSNVYESLTTTLRLFACASTKLSFATKIDDYVIPELDFSAYANAAQQVYEFTSAT